MKTLLTLFITFAKIGLFTFGGGYAMLPMLTRVVAGEKKWATEEELLNFYAVAQCTPGIIAVNTATFIGAKQKGIPGAVFATLGVIFPSVVIITFIAAFLNSYSGSETAQNALAGVRTAACALITVSVFKLARQSVIGVITGLIAVTAFASVVFFGISPVFPVLAAGIFGALRAIVLTRKEAQK
ncbi:MAG: chromate transporter [Oscillospiraceae bacterium]|jgi:chromate transporter|nr:chromate transporter [Oscillospiraceae bacterium]